MAEAETAAQRRQAQCTVPTAAQRRQPQQQIRGGDSTHLPPVKVQHQQVSFASVVHSQKMEQDQQRSVMGNKSQ